MRYTMITFGTEGDGRPLVALGEALIAAGHEVTLLADRSSEKIADAADVPFQATAGDMAAIMAEGATSDYVNQGGGALTELRLLRRTAEDYLTEWEESLYEAAKGSDAIIGASFTVTAALDIAEVLGIPGIAAFLQPWEATEEFPSPYGSPRIPSPLRHPFGNVAMLAIWQAVETPANAARARFGLRPRSSFYEGYPSLCAWSPTLLPKPSDWRDNIRVTGDWPLPSAGWTPPDDLRAFVEDGEPPLYVGFGSMTVGERLMTKIIHALGDRRTVLASGWSGLEDLDLPETIFRVGHTSHDWLLPRCSAAMHHAGAGTCHAVARAGIPSIPVPFITDQPFWASVLRRAGVASRPLSPHDFALTRFEIRRAIDEALRLADRAAEFGVRMRTEDGVAAAVATLESGLR